MALDPNVEHYLAAAKLEEIPETLDDLHVVEFERDDLARARRRADLMTQIWCAGHDLTSRLAALETMVTANTVSAEKADKVRQALEHMYNVSNRLLPPIEIETALSEIGILTSDNTYLTEAERVSLDQEGFVNLGCLLDAQQLEQIRERADAHGKCAYIYSQKIVR
ncbi:MAG: hypothetical protein AAF512_15680 [Pseudomonadota bacterium]